MPGPNLENVRKWVEALRSGEYQQTTEALRQRVYEDDVFDAEPVYGYCCLGVACEISGVGSWTDATTYAVDQDGWEGRDWSETSLPLGVREWLGIEEDNPALLGGSVNAIQMNDNDERSFAEIADAIEETYLR